jgi:hypothetical protein
LRSDDTLLKERITGGKSKDIDLRKKFAVKGFAGKSHNIIKESEREVSENSNEQGKLGQGQKRLLMTLQFEADEGPSVSQ